MEYAGFARMDPKDQNGMESVITEMIVLEGYRITDFMCVVMMMSVSPYLLPTPLSFN